MVKPELGGARITGYGAGERAALPKGWKLIPDQSGEGGLQFVEVTNPTPGIELVPTEE